MQPVQTLPTPFRPPLDISEPPCSAQIASLQKDPQGERREGKEGEGKGGGGTRNIQTSIHGGIGKCGIVVSGGVL